MKALPKVNSFLVFQHLFKKKFLLLHNNCTPPSGERTTQAFAFGYIILNIMHGSLGHVILSIVFTN